MRKNAIAVACVSLLLAAVAVGVYGAPVDGAPSLGAVAGSAQAGADVAALGQNAAGQGQPEAAAQGETAPFGGAEYEPGVALVSFAEDAGDQQRAVSRLAAETGLYGLAVADEGPGYVTLSLPDGIATDEAVDRIAASALVDGVQPNFVYHVAESGSGAAAFITPRATLDLEAGEVRLNTQASIIDNSEETLWHLGASNGIDAYGAWDIVKNHSYDDAADSTVAAKRVTVAVLDNCFAIGHDDLKNNVVEAYSVTDVPTANIAVPGTGESESNKRHGTHVLGIVAAQANNAEGTAAGVSYNARIMPVRVSDSSGEITSDYLVKAYRYVLGKASDYNVRVINISIGGGRSSASWSSDDKLLFRQIDLARERGIVSVAAACNTGGSFSAAPFYAFPADYSGCVTVIAVDKAGERVSSSNYNMEGQTVKNISAPGQGIFSTYMSGYGTSSGTSMAAPMVSGTLALMFAKDSSLTADQAVSRLYSSATDLGDPGWDRQTGFGRVNAYAAVTETASIAGGSAVGKGSKLALSVAGSGGTWTWKSSDDAIATVSDGVVTGVATGSAEITATDGATVLRQLVTVYDPAILSDTDGFAISDGSAAMTYLDSARLKVLDADGGQPVSAWTWSSSDPDVVSVGSATGTIAARAVGVADITVSLDSDPSVSAKLTVKVSARDISGATISLSPSSFAYTGQACEPSVRYVSVVGRPLISGTDYTVMGYSNNVDVGQGTVTVLGLSNYKGSATANFTIYAQDDPSAPDPATGGFEMHRLYNPYSGEHFYTADAQERDDVVAAGWEYEGVGWTAPSTGDDVYRLYNPYSGDHHYTLSAFERDVLAAIGWVDEGVGWRSDVTRAVPLYREYNPYKFSCNHNYTADKQEHDGLVALGWLDEGIAWYGMA